MINLGELKEKTEKLTVLYVEDSSALLRQVGNFLKKLFKEVYFASDGLEGLNSYKELKQDIVVTDLTMPNMTGHEMIKELKEINPDIKIIVVSAHSDSENFTKAINMGVSDFVPKPIDNKLLQNALVKVVGELTGDESLTGGDMNGIGDLMKKFEIVSRSNMEVEFINEYRGVLIVNKGNIINTQEQSITVKTPYIQTLATNYQKFTIFQSEFIKKTIKADMESINPDNKQIKLKNFEELQFSPKNRKHARLEPDDEFIAIIHTKSAKISAKAKDISIDSVSITVSARKLNVKKGDEINMTFGLKIYNEEQVTTLEQNERIYVKGKVFKAQTYSSGDMEIVVLFELNKSDMNLLERYIQSRQMELIEEFRQLKKI